MDSVRTERTFELVKRRFEQLWAVCESEIIHARRVQATADSELLGLPLMKAIRWQIDHMRMSHFSRVAPLERLATDPLNHLSSNYRGLWNGFLQSREILTDDVFEALALGVSPVGIGVHYRSCWAKVVRDLVSTHLKILGAPSRTASGPRPGHEPIFDDVSFRAVDAEFNKLAEFCFCGGDHENQVAWRLMDVAQPVTVTVVSGSTPTGQKKTSHKKTTKKRKPGPPADPIYDLDGNVVNDAQLDQWHGIWQKSGPTKANEALKLSPEQGEKLRQRFDKRQKREANKKATRKHR